MTIEQTACVRIRSVCAFLTCRGGTGGFQLTEWGQSAWMSHNRQEFTECWTLAAHTPQTWNAAQQSQRRGHYVTCGLRATSARVAAPLATSEVKAKPGCHLVTSHNSMTVFVCYHGQTRPRYTYSSSNYKRDGYEHPGRCLCVFMPPSHSLLHC